MFRECEGCQERREKIRKMIRGVVEWSKNPVGQPPLPGTASAPPIPATTNPNQKEKKD